MNNPSPKKAVQSMKPFLSGFLIVLMRSKQCLKSMKPFTYSVYDQKLDTIACP